MISQLNMKRYPRDVMKSEESNRVAAAFRCRRALVIIVLSSIKKSFCIWKPFLYLEAILFCFVLFCSVLFCFFVVVVLCCVFTQAAWVVIAITSCFVKSLPLPHLLANIF